jgi:microcystin-dependent protein
MEPFLGQIKMFAGNFAPRGYAFCDGQLLSIASNTALFSLLGTIYGGDGRTTFGLPDLRGRLPVHQGTGFGLTPRNIGQKAGVETVVLTAGQLPVHTHTPQATNIPGSGSSPAGAVPAGATGGSYYTAEEPTEEMNAGVVSNAGGNQQHTNVMPFFCINFIIALTGLYPSRT